MKIFVSNDVDVKGVEILQEHFGMDAVDVMPNLLEDDLIKIIDRYDGVLSRSQISFSKRLLEAATNLKVIGRCGVGVDNIDVPSATSQGIVVCNTPTSNTATVAEFTCAMILAIARRIPQAHSSIQDGRWDRKIFNGVELKGKTLGIIGLGHIGSRVAKLMEAFEMKIIAYDPDKRMGIPCQSGVKLVDLDVLLAESDFITIHTPLTDKTKNFINAETIKKMKDGVYLLNIARGKCMDLYAVADALRSGKIAGAAIDVYPKEPLTLEDNILKGLGNVVQTPHLGASTKEAQIQVAVDGANSVIDVLENRFPKTAVNMLA